MVSGNPTNGRDETPFLSAENSIPGEVDTVVRGAFHPRDHCEEDASLPSDKKKGEDGLNSPINKPRASHRLIGERPTPAKVGVSPHEPEGFYTRLQNLRNT